MNIILNEKYEKRTGKGKYAPLSGEYGWREISYHSTWDRVADKLESLDRDSSAIKEIRDLGVSLKEIKEEIAELLSSNIQNNME